MTIEPTTTAVTVYCGSSTGNQPAFVKAALSVGTALATSNRRLVYGGSHRGLMGTVSRAVLNGGGFVTSILPYAMVAAGGEGEKVRQPKSIQEPDDEHLETIVVDSMHTRKVEMAKRCCGFVGLPGGFGTFEEVFEVTTWTQLGIHTKPVILLNVLGFYDPVRQQIRNSIEAGFIQPYNESLITFVDGPSSKDEHAEYDWGKAALEALQEWHEKNKTNDLKKGKNVFDWTRKTGDENVKVDALSVS
ncbi:hypothetical protein Moror_8270 [Moniliophthora roreri MCA 2997]|uniref:Lysine decarboxylase-like protein n=1 Tax=Moniliophthora roreri (strain MCA 2997) TaxID=1381753 RepID=V2XP34_MONRO|nr:hypothetical protein Moror_8270 [Moniliophthora roreri MCA 2997]